MQAFYGTGVHGICFEVPILNIIRSPTRDALCFTRNNLLCWYLSWPIKRPVKRNRYWKSNGWAVILLEVIGSKSTPSIETWRDGTFTLCSTMRNEYRKTKQCNPTTTTADISRSDNRVSSPYLTTGLAIPYVGNATHAKVAPKTHD